MYVRYARSLAAVGNRFHGQSNPTVTVNSNEFTGPLSELLVDSNGNKTGSCLSLYYCYNRMRTVWHIAVAISLQTDISAVA